MPIFDKSLEVHLFPNVVPPVLKERQARSYYHKEYNNRYVNMEPVCEIDPACANEVVCGIKFDEFLKKDENKTFLFFELTIEICDKILTQLYISFDDLENGLREAYTKPFKIRTVGRHPVLVTFQSYGGLVKCTPHKVTFKINLKDQQIDQTQTYLHFVNRFKILQSEQPLAPIANTHAKRSREEFIGSSDISFDNAYQRQWREYDNMQQVATSSRGGISQDAYYGHCRPLKRSRTDFIPRDQFNEYQSNERDYQHRKRFRKDYSLPSRHTDRLDDYQHGYERMIAPVPSNGNSSSLRQQMERSVSAQFASSFGPAYDKSNEKKSDHSAPLSVDENADQVRVKLEPEDNINPINLEPVQPQIIIKDEPQEFVSLPYDEPFQPQDQIEPIEKSDAASSSSSASLIKQKVNGDAPPNIPTRQAAEGIQDGLASENTAIRPGQSFSDKQLGDVTDNNRERAVCLSSVSTNGATVKTGMMRIKEEFDETENNPAFMADLKRKMLERAAASRSDLARQKASIDAHRQKQDLSEQAVNQTSFLSGSEHPSTSERQPSTAAQDANATTVLQPKVDKQIIQANQIAFNSSGETLVSLKSHLLNVSGDKAAQSSSKSVPSTASTSQATQRSNPSLKCAMPVKTLRSCLSRKEPGNNVGKIVSFNNRAECDDGEIIDV